jgi:hypothetical protein
LGRILDFLEETSWLLLKVESFFKFLPFLSNFNHLKYFLEINLNILDFVDFTKLFETLQNKQDVFPLFEVDSLEDEKLF